jgi:hypothetical protein
MSARMLYQRRGNWLSSSRYFVCPAVLVATVGRGGGYETSAPEAMIDIDQPTAVASANWPPRAPGV